MFVLLGAIAGTAAVVVRLVHVIASDRPTSPPRSHHHELDRYSTRGV